MKGLVEIREKSTKMSDYGRDGAVDVEVSFSIYYEDGQIISTEIVFGKYYFTHQDILTAIQKYFKGELQFK